MRGEGMLSSRIGYSLRTGLKMHVGAGGPLALRDLSLTISQLCIFKLFKALELFLVKGQVLQMLGNHSIHPLLETHDPQSLLLLMKCSLNLNLITASIILSFLPKPREGKPLG